MPKSSAIRPKILNLFCALAFQLHNKRFQGGVGAASGNALCQIGLDAVQGFAGRKTARKMGAGGTTPTGTLDQVTDFDIQFSLNVLFAQIHGQRAFFVACRTAG
jgi:hypothetical protein